VKLTARVITFVAGLTARQPYRSPTPEERQTAARGFAKLLDGVPAELSDLGFSVEDDVDDETGTSYTLAVNEPGTDRAWGLYVVDRSAPPSLAVEVPHSNSDLRTELVGLEYFRQVRGAVLLVAGAHRRAGGRTADVAHQPRSVFHAVAAELAERGLPQVQLHGFNDLRMPGVDVVLSTGRAPVGAPAKRAAERLLAAGFDVACAWEEPCAGLAGMTNSQGIVAAAVGTTFLHVELNRTVREDVVQREAVVAALTQARLDQA
jgi:hypothetical protein